jgi:hypothetical protein
MAFSFILCSVFAVNQYVTTDICVSCCVFIIIVKSANEFAMHDDDELCDFDRRRRRACVCVELEETLLTQLTRYIYVADLDSRSAATGTNNCPMCRRITGRCRIRKIRPTRVDVGGVRVYARKVGARRTQQHHRDAKPVLPSLSLFFFFLPLSSTVAV